MSVAHIHAQQALVEDSMHWPAATCTITGAAVIRDRVTAEDSPQFVSHQVDVPVTFGNMTAVAHRYALTSLAHDHFDLCSEAERFAARFASGREVPCWISPTDQTRVKLDPTQAPPVEGHEILALMMTWAWFLGLPWLLGVAGLPVARRIEMSQRVSWLCYAASVAVAYFATAAAVRLTPVSIASGPADAQLRPPSLELPCVQQPCVAQDCSNSLSNSSRLSSWSSVMGIFAGGLLVWWLKNVHALRRSRHFFDPRHSAEADARVTAKRLEEELDYEGDSTTWYLLSYHFTARNARGEASEQVSAVAEPLEPTGHPHPTSSSLPLTPGSPPPPPGAGQRGGGAGRV